MDATELLDRILSRLNSPKWLFQGLVDQFHPHAKALPMLIRKLMRVQEVVGGIGSDEIEVACDWRERVAVLWVKYDDRSIASMCSNADSLDGECFRDNFAGPNTRSPSPAKPAHYFGSPDSSQNAVKSPVFSEPILKCITPSSYPVYKPPPRNITPAEEEENFPKDNSERQLSKTALRAKMQDSFYDIQLDSSLDIDGLAAMLRMISRSSKLLVPYDRDARLKWDIYGYAFDKLPFDLQKKYRDDFSMKSKPKSLPNLFHWLRCQISKIYLTVHKLADLDSDSGESLNSSFNELGDQILCFECFQFGHTKTRCTNSQLFISQDDTLDGRSFRQSPRPF